MTSSKCNSCNNSTFEVVEKSPARSNFKLLFVQCSSCGSVVGVMDFFNIGSLLKVVEKKIDENKSKINDIERKINNIERKIK